MGSLFLFFAGRHAQFCRILGQLARGTPTYGMHALHTSAQLAGRSILYRRALYEICVWYLYCILEEIKLILGSLQQRRLMYRWHILSYHKLFVHAAAIFGKISNIKYQITWYPLLLIFKKSGRSTCNQFYGA